MIFEPGGEPGGGWGSTGESSSSVGVIDVRCGIYADQEANTTTSFSNENVRNRAAAVMLNQAYIKKYNAAAYVLLARGATFNVRYADGGTESFIWLKVLSTDPDLMVKSKGDLKKGSGNVESKNCG